MKLIEEARATLAAAHMNMRPELIAAHAIELAGVIACQDITISALCRTISNLTARPSAFIPVEQSWPSVYNGGAIDG